MNQGASSESETKNWNLELSQGFGPWAAWNSVVSVPEVCQGGEGGKERNWGRMLVPNEEEEEKEMMT